MNKGLIESVIAALLMGVMVPASHAALFNQTIGQGADGGVAFSFLTTGTNDTGGGNNGAWRITGSILVDYDASGGGSVTQVGSAVLTITDGGVNIGTLTISGLNLHDPFGNDGLSLGSMDFEVASSSIGNDSGTIYFLDKDYGAPGNTNGFNGFSVDNGFLSLHLWGNQTVDPMSGEMPDGPNWGLDWSSRGMAIPAPGAASLGMIGLGMVGFLRRRLES